MKYLLLFCLLPFAVSALSPEELPDSIFISAGKTVLRLDKTKRWHINCINYANRRMCLDSPGAHYGTVFSYPDAPGFCGSGHTETGYVEEVQSFAIWQDGREISAEELKRAPVMGRKIQMEKRSVIRDFSIVYRFTLFENILEEKVEVTAHKDVKLNLAYHFMHPWRNDFDEMIAVDANGNETGYTFKGDGSFAIRGKAHPLVAWYDRSSGYGAVTLMLPGKNQKAPARLVWDRNIYRKDYFADYNGSIFPKGITAVYHIKTGFFRSNQANWKKTAKTLLKLSPEI